MPSIRELLSPLFAFNPGLLVHGPHLLRFPQLVPKLADKYKGKFDQGWDKLREEVFARQKSMGWIPGKGVALDGIPSGWINPSSASNPSRRAPHRKRLRFLSPPVAFSNGTSR